MTKSKEVGWGGVGDRDKQNHATGCREADIWHAAAWSSSLCLELAPREEEVVGGARVM